MKRTAQEMVSRWEDRRRHGDQARVARRTGYSKGHVNNMINGRARLNEDVARDLDRISSRRVDNYTLAVRHNMSVRDVQREFA